MISPPPVSVLSSAAENLEARLPEPEPASSFSSSANLVRAWWEMPTPSRAALRQIIEAEILSRSFPRGNRRREKLFLAKESMQGTKKSLPLSAVSYLMTHSRCFALITLKFLPPSNIYFVLHPRLTFRMWSVWKWRLRGRLCRGCQPCGWGSRGCCRDQTWRRQS